MFIFTAKLHRGRIVLGVAALILACGIFTALAGFHSLWSSERVAAPMDHKGVHSNEDRISYLAQYGWEVDPDLLAEETLKVPKSFDASYDEYLAMQAEQGFDLTQYAGKKVKRYTYNLLNYPNEENGMQVSLLIYKDTVIGGEVVSSLDGSHCHGLAFPE